MYQIHIMQVNALGMNYVFNSEYMSLADVLQLKDEYPHSIITYYDGKGHRKYAS